MSTNLLKGNTNKILISMSLPISVGMLSTFLFQVIDTYFVGQLGANSLAALSFASTLYFLILGLFMGLSVGVSIPIAQAKGEGNHLKLSKIVKVSLMLSLLLSISISVISIQFLFPIFSLLGAEPEIIPLIQEYLRPLLLGIPLLTLGLLIGSILRANGNVSKPELLMAFSGVINLVLDYLLIFGAFGFPELGIKGAAYASVFSWLVIIIGMLYFLYKEEILLNTRSLSLNTKEILKEIQKISTPTIITQMIGPLTLTYLTFILAKQSALAVAAFGVSGRIETLLLIGVLGVSTAMTPFISQNKGAQFASRVEEAIKFGGKASVYLGLFVALILFIFIKPIAALFSENTEVIDYTSNYFYIVGLSYVFYGLYIITSSIFNGLSLIFQSLKLSLVKSFAFTIPLTLLGSFWGINGIYIGLAASNVLAGLFSAYEMRKDFRRVNSDLKDVVVWKEYRKDLSGLF